MLVVILLQVQTIKGKSGTTKPSSKYFSLHHICTNKTHNLSAQAHNLPLFIWDLTKSGPKGAVNDYVWEFIAQMVLRVCTLHHSKWKQLVSITSFWILITYLIPCSAFILTTLHSQDRQWWQIPPFPLLFLFISCFVLIKVSQKTVRLKNTFGSLFGVFFHLFKPEWKSRPPKLKSWIVHGHSQFRWRGLTLKSKPDQCMVGWR